MDVLRRRNDLSTSLSPSLSHTHTRTHTHIHTKCFLLNCAISLCLWLYIIVPQNRSPPSRFFSQPVPCLIAFPLNHCNTAFPHFMLVLIFQESTALPSPETFTRVIKGLGWPKQLPRDLISHVSPYNMTQESGRGRRGGRGMNSTGGGRGTQVSAFYTKLSLDHCRWSAEKKRLQPGQIWNRYLRVWKKCYQHKDTFSIRTT